MSLNSPTDFPRDLLFRYDSISYLARGGMGILFRAHDKQLDKFVAIKALPSRSLLGSKKVVRFQKEAKLAGRLSHPNIVKIFDFGVTGSGDPYLVMEYIDGPSLSSQLEESGTPDLLTALNYFIEIASGLAHAHKNSVIHRDVKPSNVMLEQIDNGFPTAKVVDFGVAHMRRSDTAEGFESTGGNIIGSPGYVSPEVVSGGKADARSDIYSTGCLMFETLSGELPFKSENAMEVFAAHVNDKPPEIIDWLAQEEEAPELASALASVVMRCLEKNPDKRYQNAGELFDALCACEEFLPEEKRVTRKVDDVPSDNAFRSASLIPLQRIGQGFRFFAFFALPLIVILVLSQSIFFAAKPQKATKVKLDKVATGLENQLHYFEQAIAPLPSIGGDLVADVVYGAPDVTEGKRLYRKGKVHAESAQITDAAMAKLAQLPVYDMDIKATKVSAKGISEIGKMKHLFCLSLERIPNLTDEKLDIIPGLPKLERLSVAHTPVTDKGLNIISKNKNLTSLSVINCQKLTTSGIRPFKTLPRLVTLSIGHTPISPIGLKDFPQLADLNIEFKEISNEEMKAIASIKTLKKLTVTGCTSFNRTKLFMLLDCPELLRVQMALISDFDKHDLKDFNREFYHRYKRQVQIYTDFPYP